VSPKGKFISARTHLCVHAARWINISMMPICLNVPLSPSVSQLPRIGSEDTQTKGAALISVGSECRRLCSNFQLHSN